MVKIYIKFFTTENILWTFHLSKTKFKIYDFWYVKKIYMLVNKTIMYYNLCTCLCWNFFHCTLGLFSSSWSFSWKVHLRKLKQVKHEIEAEHILQWVSYIICIYIFKSKFCSSLYCQNAFEFCFNWIWNDNFGKYFKIYCGRIEIYKSIPYILICISYFLHSPNQFRICSFIWKLFVLIITLVVLQTGIMPKNVHNPAAVHGVFFQRSGAGKDAQPLVCHPTWRSGGEI